MNFIFDICLLEFFIQIYDCWVSFQSNTLPVFVAGCQRYFPKRNVKIEICIVKQHFQQIKCSETKYNQCFISIPSDSNAMNLTILGIE